MVAEIMTEEAKERPVSLAAIFAASVLSAAGALVFNAFPLFLSTLADQFALSDQQLGLLGTSFLGAFAFVALAALWWLPRLSWKWLGVISYLFIGGSLLGFRAVTAEHVFWLMGIYGMGSGIIFTLSLNVLAHARDPDRAYGIKLIFEMALAGLLIFTMTSWLIGRFGFPGFIYGTLILYAASAVFVFWIPNKLLQENRQQHLTGGQSNKAAWLASFGLFVQFAAFAGLWGFMERIGAATGAIAGSRADVGVDDKFIKEVGDDIEPGHSALFLLVTDSTPDKVMDGLSGFNPTVYQTSLSEEDEANLRAAFGEED